MRRYYEILGVPSGATPAEIREAWLFSVKAFHPDKFSSSSEHQKQTASERTQAINEAYNVLSDPVRRHEYDVKRAANSVASGIANRPTPPPSSAPVWTDEDEDLIEKCIEVIRQERRASTSLLQRRLRLGFTRAARIIDVLEQRGILGPGVGAAPRKILVDLDGQSPDHRPLLKNLG